MSRSPAAPPSAKAPLFVELARNRLEAATVEILGVDTPHELGLRVVDLGNRELTPDCIALPSSTYP